MTPVNIKTIDSAPKSIGGGLYINGEIYVDPKYEIRLIWDNNTISIVTDDQKDTYIGAISSIVINGKSNPASITDVINWLKVGSTDVGGDGGFTVSITFNPQYFTGDGSNDNPVSLRVEEIPVAASNVVLAMDPSVFSINDDGLITLKPNATLNVGEVTANRYTLVEQEINK